MKVFITLLSLMLGGSHALTGNSHPEWIGKNVKDAGLPSRTQPTIYVFAQPDCASCSLQLAALASLQKTIKKTKILLINEQNSATLQEYLQGFSLKLETYADLEGTSISKLHLNTIPAVLLVDAAGNIQGFYEGTLTGAEIKELGSALVSELPVRKLTVPGQVGSQAQTLPGVDWKNNKNNLIVFHSSTCRFCTDGLPYLVDYVRKNPKISVWVVAPTDIGGVRKQFADAQAPSNIFFVENSKSQEQQGEFYVEYKIAGAPTQLLVDDAGVIQWRGEGFSFLNTNPFAAGKIPLK